MDCGGSGMDKKTKRDYENPKNFGYIPCDAGGHVLDVTLKVQTSTKVANCTKGETFGISGNNIWVDKGCRGYFIVLKGNSIPNVPRNI